MAKKKSVKKTKPTKKNTKKVKATKTKKNKNLAQLADDIYRYDGEEKLQEFFSVKHPSENYEDPDFDDQEEEDEYFGKNLCAEDRRADAVFEEYCSLIEEILEDPKMKLHEELKSLSEEELQVVKDNVYTEIYAGVV